MNDSTRQTRSHLQRLFQQQHRHPRHDLGQNFLIDLNLHELIVRHAKLSTADAVLEVGTGTGGLTTHLADSAGHVVSIEYDSHVFAHAQRALTGRANVTLLQGDVLENKNTLNPLVVEAVRSALVRVAEEERETQGRHSLGFPEDNEWRLRPAATTLKLVANLPYHIATPVISNLVASDLPWSLMVVTIQWELAQRMLAAPGTSDYSALSVWMQSQARMQIIRKLPPSVFWPPPKVDSAVLVVERDLEAQSKIADREFFHAFLRDVFTQRRKKLIGVLVKFDAKSRVGNQRKISLPRERVETAFIETEIRIDSRAEQLTPNALVQLSNRLNLCTLEAK